MRAIETRYAGRLFRSRLEARYAVLFDALRIEWGYEPEGFEFEDGTRYLPDFWLPLATDDHLTIEYPGSGHWVEIKAGEPTTSERRRMYLLTTKSGHTGYIFAGTPDRVAVYSFHRSGRGGPSGRTGLFDNRERTHRDDDLHHPLNACLGLRPSLFTHRFPGDLTKAIERA